MGTREANLLYCGERIYTLEGRGDLLTFDPATLKFSLITDDLAFASLSFNYTLVVTLKDYPAIPAVRNDFKVKVTECILEKLEIEPSDPIAKHPVLTYQIGFDSLVQSFPEFVQTPACNFVIATKFLKKP